jgi:acetyl-CoA C-acetyltransferase
MKKGEFAIIGVGQVPTGNFPERTEYEIAYTVARDAIRDAGISKDDIGAVLGAAHIMGGDYNTELFFGRLPEAIGLSNCKIHACTVSGGASSLSIRKTAEGILRSGEAEFVLIVHAQRFSQFKVPDQLHYFSTAGSDSEFEIPYGMTYNALSAMITQGYMSVTGTTMEQMASVPVAMRRWALLNENALFYGKKELTIDKVLNAQMVAYPLTTEMCNVLSDGGSAFIMTTAEKAREVCKNPVYIISEASYFSHRVITRNKGSLSDMSALMRPTAQLAYERAGIRPRDINIWELYGSYPVISLMLMDAVGMCEPGKSGALVEAGETSPGGKYPVSTNGEAMGMGHTGTGVGFCMMVESVRQLQGRAGKAQIPNPTFVMENCGGGAFADFHFTILGNEIPK